MNEAWEQDLFEKAVKLNVLKQRCADLTLELDSAKKERDDLKYAMCRVMEAHDVDSVSNPEIGKVRKWSTIYGNISSEGMEDAQKWAEENGMFAVFFKVAVQKKAVNDFVRTKIAANEPMPPGIQWSPKEEVSFSEARVKTVKGGVENGG